MEDASFAQSFDLYTLILAMHRGASLDGGAIAANITVGQTWATRKNQHWGRLERTECSLPLITTRKRGVVRKKRKEIEVSVPARTRRVHKVRLPARREVQLQKSIGGVRSQISSANALQKERSGSSERGPRSARRSAGETVGRHVE
jgi:hypothetical protein